VIRLNETFRREIQLERSSQRPEGRPQTVEAWQRVLLRQVGASESRRSAGAAPAGPVTRLEVESRLGENTAPARQETKKTGESPVSQSRPTPAGRRAAEAQRHRASPRRGVRRPIRLVYLLAAGGALLLAVLGLTLFREPHGAFTALMYAGLAFAIAGGMFELKGWARLLFWTVGVLIAVGFM
jgi:hypothetical protein